MVALLEAQEHRRFIKTHTPLDGLPEHPLVTYICVGCDPRDVMRSWENHVANADIERIIALRERAVRSGRRREWLGDDDMPRVDARVAELVEPDLARWAHHGWLGA